MKKKGFTLIEVLLATIILAIGLIGTSAFFYANRRNLYNARLEREATWKAIERMEWAKGLPVPILVDELPLGAPVVEDNVISLGNNVEAVRTTERKPPAEEDVDYWEIEVKVTYTVSDIDKEVSVNTYIAY